MKQVILFLEGKQEAIISEMERQMKAAAESLDFEKAAKLRDQVQAIQSVIEGQRIAATVSGEQDVIAFATERDQTCVQVFFIRGGKLIGRESFNLAGTNAEEPEQIMTSFVKQFYASATNIPPLLVLQHAIDDQAAIQGWLKKKRNGAVKIVVPRKGNKKQLIEIVAQNAAHSLQQEKIKQFATGNSLDEALRELQQILGLQKLPDRVEGYDISNIQGKEAVGSMVVFEHGRPRPAHYRRFRIKTIPEANDYAMLQEVLQRRFKHASFDDTTASDSWRILPDLVLIDGGKGQLNAAQTVMKEVGVDSVPIVSLAKENEEIFTPKRQSSIVLPRNSHGLQLLQRLRDEAHRFALSYHTKVRKRKTFASSLDNVPGIGPHRKRALLLKFGTVSAIRNASIEELTGVDGITPSLVEKLKEHLG
jgi:excinuclease ABC subunit C